MSDKAIEVIAQTLKAIDDDWIATRQPASAHEHACVILAALKSARIAVVELPEPVTDDDPTAYLAFSGSNHIYFAHPGGEGVESDDRQKWQHVEDARDDAAALLAAADASELVSDD